MGGEYSHHCAIPALPEPFTVTYSVDCLCEFLDCGGAIKTKHLNNNKSKSHAQLLLSSLNSLSNRKKQTATTKHEVRNDLIQDFFDEVKVNQHGHERRLPS